MFGDEDNLQTLNLSWWHLNDKVKKIVCFIITVWVQAVLLFIQTIN